MTRDNYLTPQRRSKIKEILPQITDMNGNQQHAWEICYDMLVNSYDQKRATLHDVMLWLQSIEHMHADLRPIVSNYLLFLENVRGLSLL